MKRGAAIIPKLFSWFFAALGAAVLVALSIKGAAALPAWFWIALAMALVAGAVGLMFGPYTTAERFARLRRAVVRIAAPLWLLVLYAAATHILESSTGIKDARFDALVDLTDAIKASGIAIVLGGLIIALFAEISRRRDDKRPSRRLDKTPFRRGDRLPPSQREN